MYQHYFLLNKRTTLLLSIILFAITANSQAPQQPTNLTPAAGTTNYANNTVTVTVTDPNGDPMTVKLYGHKKNCPSTAPNFCVIGLPDTQFYTEEVQGTNSAGGGNNGIFKSQTQWIAAHRVDSNIVFVSQLGDCVQNGDAPPGSDNQIEWKRADTAMKNIENPAVPITDGIPYSICVGNHDETPTGSITGTTTFFNQYFGTARFTGRGYYGGRFGATNNNDHYELFSSGGIDFIHISIEYFPDGLSAKLQSILDWADALLKANPTRKAILSTHNLLSTGNPANFQGPGQKIYDDLKDNPNLFLMLAGHVNGEGFRSDTYNGNTIYSLMSDYQSGNNGVGGNGGNGYLRIMQFRPAENIITIRTYSPYANTSLTTSSSKFSIPVTFSCPYTLIGTNTGVTSGSSTTFTWPGLELSTDYEWYVTIDDGNGNITTSSVSGFTTWNGVPLTSTGSLRFTDTTYVNLGNAAELKLTNFTLEAWVKIEDYGSTAQTGGGGLTKFVPIISKGRAEGEAAVIDVNYILGYELGTNKLVADFEDGTSANHPVKSNATIQPNTWTHVGASFDVATKTWRLFIGAATEPTVLGGTFIPQSGSNVSACIGATLNSTNVPLGSFNGRIDEVRIWNTALTSLPAGEVTSGTGLVGRWGFGDGVGTTVTNSISGGANGTIVNTYEWVTGFNEPDPTTNGSIRFNGKDDYVTFGAAPSLGATTYTLEGWINIGGPGTLLPTTGTGGLTNIYPIISKGRNESDGSNLDMNYFLGLDATYHLVTDFEDIPSGNNHTLAGPTALPLNQWRHIAVTYDGSVQKLYLNGVLENTSAVIGIAPQSASIQHAAVGSALNSTGVASGFFNGKIDEVRIWNRALTQAEIQANMNNEITGVTPNLIGRWGFNDNGDTIANKSSGSVNGLLRGLNPYYTEPSFGAASWVSSGFIPTVTVPTSTSSTTSAGSIEYGTTTISFSTTVSPNPGGGSVQFYVDGVAVGAPVAVAAGTAIATLSTYNPALLNVGSHSVRGDFLGNGAFAGSTGTNTSFSVTPAVLTYNALGASRPYGAANPALTGTVTGFKNGQTVATATTGTISFTTTATVTSNAGNYPMTGAGLTANNGNYTFVQAPGNSTAFIVTDALLTITATPVSRIYGDPDPVFTGTVTGFVNGETQATATTGTLIFTSSATATSNVGSYLINGAGLTANNGNYSFQEAAANSTALTITKRPLDFSGTRIFNGTAIFTSGQLVPGNIVNNDVLSLGGSASVSSANIGTYSAFVSNTLTSSNSNYQTIGGLVDVAIITVPATNHKSIRFTDTSYVDLGNAASLHLTNFTVEAWIKIEGYASTTESGAAGSGGGQNGLVPIITKGRAQQELASVDVNYFLSYRLSDMKLVADFEDNATSLNHSVTSAATLPINTWVHVGASFDVASQKWRLFIDNNAAEVFTLTGGPFTPQSLSDVGACIGSTLNSAGGIRQGFFNGRIDEVRIWNTALTTLDPGELTTTPANLVGRWAFDEGTGNFVSNAVSGGASGTLVNKTEWVSGFNVPDPTTDASIRFNGVHDYVSFGAAPSLNTSAFTLEAWLYREGPGKTTSTGTGGVDAVPIIAKGRAEAETPNNVNMNYFLGIDAGNKLVADFEESTGPNHPVTGVTSIPNNSWTHVAATYDPVTAVWNLYINGVLDKTLDIGTNINPVNNSIQYGSVGSALNSTGVADGFFDGKIDEVKIWNKALNISELQPNSACSPTNTANLLGYWNFNENGNVAANNSVSGGVSGEIISNNISTHPTNGGPSWACNGNTGSYRSKNATGVWSTASSWEVLSGGSWITATKTPSFQDDVTITAGSSYTISGPVSCNNLTVNAGGKLYRNSSALNYVTVYGQIVCDGTIGNGATPDGISFSIEGVTCSISGAGTFDCSRIKKSCSRNTTTTLTFNLNANLRYNGTALCNETPNTFFNVNIPAGVTVNCLGDGTANSGGSVAIDGINGADPGNNAGSLTVDGTLNISGIGTAMPTLYLTNSNINVSWPISVIINPTGVINTGIINCSASGAAGHSFTITNGGKLNLTGEPSSYTAPSLANNSYTFNSGSIIEYSKTGNQTVYTFGTTNYSNLFGSGSGVKTIPAALAVADHIKMSGTANLASGGNLTLLSTATTTAQVLELPVDGAGVPLATITGDVTVQRYISSKRAWRFLSVPTNTTQTVKTAWQENMPQGSTTQTIPAGLGTQVTNNTATWSADGFDYYSPNGPSVKKWDSVNNTYVSISKTTDPIKTSEGWMTFVRGDRTAAGLSATPTSTILRTKGILYTGIQNAISVPSGDFAGIGNPYPSPLDMRNISKETGINEFFYIWDPKLGSAAAFGAFQTFSKNVSDGNYYPSPGGGSYPSQSVATPYNYIQSGQAFFVAATSNTGGKLVFKENAKTNTAPPDLVFRPGGNQSNEQKLQANLYYTDADGSSSLIDGIRIDIAENYSNSVDSKDAVKTDNFSENLAIVIGDKLLAIERKHFITGLDTIFLNMRNMKAASYQFEIKAVNFIKNGLKGYLEDCYGNNKTPINLDGTTAYNFNIINDSGSWNPARFRIIFKQGVVLPVTLKNIKAYQFNKNIAVEWEVINEFNIKQYDVEISSDGMHFTKAKAIAAIFNNNTTASYHWTDVGPVSGNHYYRIRCISNNDEVQYSDMVKVVIEGKSPQVTIYPNPISGNVINLQLINQPAGIYGIKLLNMLGQVLIIKQIKNDGGNHTNVVQINISSYAHGVYQVEVTRPDNNKVIMKLVY